MNNFSLTKKLVIGFSFIINSILSFFFIVTYLAQTSGNNFVDLLLILFLVFSSIILILLLMLGFPNILIKTNNFLNYIQVIFLTLSALLVSYILFNNSSLQMAEFYILIGILLINTAIICINIKKTKYKLNKKR